MASARDVQDIFNLGQPASRPKKKAAKRLEPQQRLSGMSREVQMLMGDSVPPIAIVEAPKYKSKPSIAHKMYRVRHWQERPFTHLARKDGLVLRHWKRSVPTPGLVAAQTPTNGTPDAEMADADSKEPPATVELRFEDEFPHEKWDVKVEIPSYTAEQYEVHLKSEDWTKEETDHLIGLAKNYDLRWILIADRYDPTEIPQPLFQPVGEGDEAVVPVQRTYPVRTMEQLKSRYYTISAKMLESQIPASNMTATQFQLWEKMKNFDAKTEVTRKAMAEKLFERTKEEADEERVLLEELARITKNEEDFIKMRKDLYSRLETAPSLRRNERGEEQSTTLYQTSQGLSMLLSSLLAKEKRRKGPVQNGTDPTSANASTPVENKGRLPGHNRRDTLESTADDGPPSKKGSISQPVAKTLTPAEEAKYGVSHTAERLTSGVMFRHEKINRITTAKSQVQTQKIQGALTELGIPPRLLMPTERVCREFERLVGEVQLLLDARRASEKVSSEVKILEEHKRIRFGIPEAPKPAGVDAMEVDNAASVGEQQQKNSALESAKAGIADETEMKAEEPKANDSAAPKPTAEEDEDEGEEAGEDEDAEKSAASDEEEVDESFTANPDAEDEDDQQEDDEDDDAEAQQEEEDEGDVDDGDDEDEEEEEEDAPGLEDLERANQVSDEDEQDEGEEEEDEEDEDEANDDDVEADDETREDEEDVEDDQAELEVDESLQNGDDEEGEDEEEMENEDDGHLEEADELEEKGASRPISSLSNAARSHKRSASVISETQSNRSGMGRKKRR